MGQTQAGLYHSVLNVEIDLASISNAIDAVVGKLFKKRGESSYSIKSKL